MTSVCGSRLPFLALLALEWWPLLTWVIRQLPVEYLRKGQPPRGPRETALRALLLTVQARNWPYGKPYPKPAGCWLVQGETQALPGQHWVGGEGHGLGQGDTGHCRAWASLVRGNRSPAT